VQDFEFGGAVLYARKMAEPAGLWRSWSCGRDADDPRGGGGTGGPPGSPFRRRAAARREGRLGGTAVPLACSVR
jgi:hypothetical protein